MFENNPEIVIGIIYKFLILTFAGFLFYLAYKDFKKDKQNKTGHISASWGSLSFTLKNNPIGTIFLIAGLLIVLMSIYQGISFDEKKTSKTQSSGQQSLSPNDSLPDLSGIKKLNIDSLLDISKKSALKEKYLESLKYLYTIQGYCIEKKCDSSILKHINSDIKIYENQLSKLLKKAFDSTNNSKTYEETRSTKISDTNNAEIR